MDNQPEYSLTIEAGRAELHYWKDIWRFRELFLFLSWRDILVRYKQMVIGIAWSVLRPLLTMIVFAVVFGKLAKLPSEGVPYPILVYVAMLPWQFFANSLTESSNSLIANANLLSKVYFPRLIIPVSSVIVSLVDFFITSVILVLLMAWYGFYPSWKVVALPGFLLLAFITSFGFGLWMAALNVKYRDFRYIVPFIVQCGLFISPVGFSSNIVPEKWRLLYSINPMVGIVDGFRWAVLGGSAGIYWPGLCFSIIVSFSVLVLGIRYFRKTERFFADVI